MTKDADISPIIEKVGVEVEIFDTTVSSSTSRTSTK